MQRTADPSSSSNNAFRVPRTKGLNRPTTWFAAPAFGSSSNSTSTMTKVPVPPSPNPFAAPLSSFKSPFPTSKGKHKLSPSPSPSTRHTDEDFIMISPIRSNHFLGLPQASASMMRDDSNSSSSPLEDSPTPACGVASATARLKLVDDESPIRRVPGQSRSLARAADEGRSIFLSTEKVRIAPTSPLKFSTTNLYPLTDGEGSPQLPETPLLGSGPPPPPPQPLFPPMRTSQSADCDANSAQAKSLFTTTHESIRIEESRIPRLSTSHPIRARAATDADRQMLGQKKAISLDAIPVTGGKDEPFGAPVGISQGFGRKTRPGTTGSMGGSSSSGRAHKRINSGDPLPHAATSSISRSFGQKSGLALSLSPGSLGPLPDFSNSNSSLSSLSTASLTPPASAFSPAEPPIFEDVKPLQEAFTQANGTVSRRFKPRDSGVSMGDEESKPIIKIPPPSTLKINVRPRRPALLKRTSSMGDEPHAPDCETPSIGPGQHSGWPNAPSFGFLGDGAVGVGLGFTQTDQKPSMPDTPVKKSAYASSHQRVTHSLSQPEMSTVTTPPKPLAESTKSNLPPPAFIPPPSTRKPQMHTMHLGSAKTRTDVLHLTLTANSSPDSLNAMDTDGSSPTVRVGANGSAQSTLGVGKVNGQAPVSRVGLLRRQSGGVASSDGSEEASTPTKGGGERTSLAPPKASPTTPMITTKPAAAPGIMPRLSLPAFAAPKLHRTLHHRQSHPAPASNMPEEHDVFEKRFITLETLGKGAFSTVVKVQERYGEGLFAVKKARGVFDGVKDRLRHLEEVDILRHLSRQPCPHVIRFVDAWEQNRQLFIQTELCLGSLAFFLEEYGRVVERLDEGRVWKIVRELSDGINHIHSNGVIHFDIKPANILISPSGSLKIGDFGLATRYPPIDPIEILKGSGLGGSTVLGGRQEKLEREGDRGYMAPEMLRGEFVMAADIFSFGVVVLEVSTNICVPENGAPFQSLRSGDFSVVDLSPLSPALTDLITQCMHPDPNRRPLIQNISHHPVVQRARGGKEALAPEDPRWLVNVLSGGIGAGFGFGFDGIVGDGDVEMMEV